MVYNYLIVGAGLFGCVMAERIANDLKSKVLVIDKRTHIGGNCYSERDDETGIEFHKYGTHIFHTNIKTVWDYINRFTEFNGYFHQVLTTHKNKVYQMPINLETINSFYNLNMKPFEAKEFIKEECVKESIKEPKNFEEYAISIVGRSLYEALIKDYTIKHWQKDPKDLPVSIFTRLPIRFNYREDYFVDSRWQGIPLNGYTKVVERLLNSPNIHVELNCDFFNYREELKVRKKIIFTGPIDQYFNNEYGRLDWRSIELQREVVDVDDYQGTSVMNYADPDIEYTRIHEPKHLHPERSYAGDETLIFYEYSRTDPEEPYYPINNERNNKTLKKYKKLAKSEKNVVFGGRLGDYAYYDMDKTIMAALNCYEKELTK